MDKTILLHKLLWRLTTVREIITTIEKEYLSLVFATKTYILDRKVKLISDHKLFRWLMNLKEPNSRFTRWRLKLAEFDLEIIYKSEKQTL